MQHWHTGTHESTNSSQKATHMLQLCSSIITRIHLLRYNHRHLSPITYSLIQLFKSCGQMFSRFITLPLHMRENSRTIHHRTIIRILLLLIAHEKLN